VGEGALAGGRGDGGNLASIDLIIDLGWNL
jgi:hypothetical protein